MSDQTRAEQIAACPTPVYHETHRYCPSCPWTEADEPGYVAPPKPVVLSAAAADKIEAALDEETCGHTAAEGCPLCKALAVLREARQT